MSAECSTSVATLLIAGFNSVSRVGQSARIVTISEDPKPKIEDLDGFRSFVQTRGHLTQREMAQQWQAPISGWAIGKALKRIGFTRKKRPTATGTR
jgi:hypothetical protein